MLKMRTYPLPMPLLITIAIITIVSDAIADEVFGSSKSPRILLGHQDSEYLRKQNFAVSLTKNIPVSNDDEYRLPQSLRPIHYKVQLQPFLNGNFSILGHVEIQIEVLETTSVVYLHIKDIVTRDETLQIALSEGSSIGVNGTKIDEIHDFYIVTLLEDLQEGKTYTLSLDFEGSLNTQGIGFYRTSYVDEEGNTKNVALTQFEAVGARRAFPCFDEPSFKATFDVYLGRQDNVSALCNMPLVETVPIEGQEGWFWDHFEKSVEMSSYLVAFVISDYAQSSTTTTLGKPYTVWSRPEMIENTQYALKKGPEVLTFFGEYLGNPFTLPKMDMVSSLGFGGAMENWGLIIFSEDAMLFDPDVQTEADKQLTMRIIAHETAHQWFGDLVTLGWWSQLWLNEGFAKYMEYIGADNVEPSWDVADQFVVNEMHKVLVFDSQEEHSRPMVMDVSSPGEIDTVVDSITYKKGASLIRMMKNILTEETFVRGLSSYLMEYQYDNALQDYLFKHLTAVGHEDGSLPFNMTMKLIMESWTLQAGYPVVTVNRTDDGTRATISQKRFWTLHEETEETWWVPLTYTNQDDLNFEDTRTVAWIPNTTTHITIDSLPSRDRWVIFNIQETGFYRVNYDDDNWALLRDQLDTDPNVIHPINRAQILDDYLHLARSGHHSYSSVLDLLLYLRKETAFISWAAALNNIDYLDYILVRTKAYEMLKDYLLDLILPLYDTVGFHIKDHATQPEIYKQVLALFWSCDLGHGPCLEQSHKLFSKWMKNPSKDKINPNLKKIVQCYAIAQGTETEWNFVWKQFLKAGNEKEKHALLDVMGCSKNPEILSRYIERAFTKNSNISKDDAVRIFVAVAKNPIGRDIAWHFLQDDTTRVIQYLDSPRSVGAMIQIVSGAFQTKEEKYQLVELEERLSVEYPKVSPVFKTVFQRVDANIAWMERNYQAIVRWLKDHGYDAN